MRWVSVLSALLRTSDPATRHNLVLLNTRIFTDTVWVARILERSRSSGGMEIASSRSS